ncbi:MAG: hypothetical protein L0H70_04220 [Xanthomonadales bacterium]|nr:hypothetical protein [Xanthomonadales bacterium]
MTSAPPIAFDCKVSPCVVVATMVIVVLALLAIVLTGMPPWLRVGLLLVISAWGAFGMVRLLHPRLRSLLWRADGSVEVSTRDRAAEDGAHVEAELRGARVLGPLVVLNLRGPGIGSLALWQLPDNTDADTLRRLRMRVKAGMEDLTGEDRAV